jgi:hypothetical protein
MKKISTLFKKDTNDLSKVVNEYNPENDWVFETKSIPTRKWDGSACAIIDSQLHKRYDAKLKPSKDFQIGDLVSKPSNKPFKNGEIIDEILEFTTNAHSPNGDKAVLLKNSQTIVSVQSLQRVGKFSSDYFKQLPEGAIPCQEPDLITGHHPHWVKCDRSKPEDRYFFEAFDSLENPADGTYELIGERVQGNIEKN